MSAAEAEPEPRRLYRGTLGRVNFEPTNRVLRTASPILYRLLGACTKFEWRHGERVPRSGPVIFVPNHISSLDPPLVGLYLVYNGRWPHFLARANLFDGRLLGSLLRGAAQIPVHRRSSRARDALVEADRALQAGAAIVMYPEGTITFDPDEWPMAGHSGAARLALRTGAPVVPIGQWGANLALPPRGIRKFRLRRRPISIICGDPVDLAEYEGAWDDREAVRAATVKILDAITEVAEQARGERAPADRWLPREKRRVPRAEALM